MRKRNIGKKLFKGEKVIEVGDMLYEMWKERRGKIVLEELKEKKERRQNRRERDLPEMYISIFTMGLQRTPGLTD